MTLRRREFIRLIGGATAAWPLAARGQQQTMPVIGFLGAATPSTQREWTDAFVQRLSKLGWIEGRNVQVEYRWAEGRNERFAEIAAEFATQRVNLIMAGTTPAAVAAKQATSIIPIVFAVVSDPVRSGLVASLARPGGNVTGISNQQTDTVGKRLQLLHDIIPGFRRLAILVNVNSANAVLEMGEVQAAATKLGLQVATLEIRQGADLSPTFDGLRGKADAL
jgi:putative ABC transport system substrate-binding protein